VVLTRFRALALLATIGLVVACAHGLTEDDGSGWEQVEGSGGQGTTSDVPTSTTSSGETTSSGQGGEGAGGNGAGANGSGANGSGANGSGANGSGASGAGGSGAGGMGAGGQGGSCNFTAPNTCSAPKTLSQIKGDKGSDTRTDTGVGSMWFKIYVEEAVSSIIEFPPLSYTAVLQSPPGMDYDMYIYTGDDKGIDCQDSPSKGSGSPEKIKKQWGDTIAVEDGTWISIEVRYVSGSACGPADNWTFTITGNT